MNCTNPVTLYALNHILDHLSEENYAATGVLALACYRGRAEARVIIRRRIACELSSSAILWDAAKGGN